VKTFGCHQLCESDVPRYHVGRIVCRRASCLPSFLPRLVGGCQSIDERVPVSERHPSTHSSANLSKGMVITTIPLITGHSPGRETEGNAMRALPPLPRTLTLRPRHFRTDSSTSPTVSAITPAPTEKTVATCLQHYQARSAASRQSVPGCQD
jgi:hypothetical protein